MEPATIAFIVILSVCALGLALILYFSPKVESEAAIIKKGSELMTGTSMRSEKRRDDLRIIVNFFTTVDSQTKFTPETTVSEFIKANPESWNTFKSIVKRNHHLLEPNATKRSKNT